MMIKLRRYFGILLVCPFLFCPTAAADENIWTRLGDGLQLGLFDAKRKSRIYNSKIVVLRIDPKFYAFTLLSASEHGRKSRTTKFWCEEFGLQAAINASMYQRDDPFKSTGFMKNYDHFNNPKVNAAFGAFMVFNPMDPSLPEVQIIDRRFRKDWKTLIRRYHTVIQNYRMISQCEKRGWPQSQEIYSTAAIGMDRDDHVLFILCRSPYSTHDFIHILLSMPICIRDAMYLEGGPEATLYFKVKAGGMSSTGDQLPQSIQREYHESPAKIPNAIGIMKKR